MPNTSDHSFFCALNAHTLLKVSSVDNLKFLQGQFTCDVREASNTQWRYGALCTSKGRVVGNFLLVQAAPNEHLLRLPLSTADAVAGTLGKFAPFYKGKVTRLDKDYRLFGLVGTKTLSALSPLFTAAPMAIGECAQTEAGILLRLDEQRHECWLKTSAADEVRLSLQAQLEERPASAWDLLSIRQGLAEVRGPTVEEWTPHMLNLQAVGAVNFKKGCYTGQEIVARTEYLGHQKRAMYRITGTGVPPADAAALLDGEQAAGEIVMSSVTDGGWEALAVIGTSHLAKPLSCLGQPVQLLDLPYALQRK